MSSSDRPVQTQTQPNAEPGRQVFPSTDDRFRAAFAEARGTVSPDIDLSADPDEPCRQGR
jgi:hypothetical protein